jgi:hypothetical protein
MMAQLLRPLLAQLFRFILQPLAVFPTPGLITAQ